MEYENRLVFFVDILGFKNLVETSPCAQIGEIFNYIRSFYEDERQSKYNKTKEITFFSDSITISFEIKDFSDVGELFLTFCDFQILLVNLVTRGIFMRGAVSYGKLFHNENFLFGPAFIEAYLHETKKAIYPRIICSKSVAVESLLEVEPDFNEILTTDEDGFVYLDYFAKGAQGLGDYDEGTEYLRKLNEVIEEKFREPSVIDNQSIREKFTWVRNALDKSLDKNPET